MKNLGKIIQFEYLECVRNKAFIIITVVILLFVFAASFLPGLISGFSEQESGDDPEAPMMIAVSCDSSIYGADLVNSEFCRYFPKTPVLLTDEDTESIKAKVNKGEYQFAVKIISPLEFTYITKNNSLYDTNMEISSEVVKAMYTASSLEPFGVSNEQSDKLLSAPVKRTVLTTGTDQSENYLPTYILMILLFVSITSYGQIVAQSVVSEKNTRAMELLITCARPTELMFGKVIGSGLAGFTQLAIILTASVGTLNTVSAKTIPPEILEYIKIEPQSAALAVMFFILGYFMYAFLIGALASCASKSEDLSNLISPVVMFMTIVYMVLIFMSMSENYDNPVLVAMSYLPLCAPMAMFIRATLTDIAVWEIILSAALQLVYIILIGFAAAAIYRAGVLMYGTPPKPAEIIRIITNSRKQKSNNPKN